MDRKRVLVGLVVLVVLAGGLWWLLRPTPVAEGVLFVGDSVTVLSLDDLNGDLGRKHPGYITRSGYRSSDLLPLFEQEVERRQAAGEPLRQVALLVGYNDVLQDDVETPSLGKVMALADRFECAVWLLLPPIPILERETDRWNERVVAAARAHPNVHVVDTWRQEVVESEPLSLVAKEDGVHPNEAGRRRLNKVYQEAIGSEC
ncbi:MAG TPA: SGNH/GDSL hydrolase family protein [Aquihabitans sp.]|jgi:lysophospholipase L1-like esterase|nr:SGNH/GDSL hydrolase family protein [Aquihabitans sp.]